MRWRNVDFRGRIILSLVVIIVILMGVLVFQNRDRYVVESFVYVENSYCSDAFPVETVDLYKELGEDGSLGSKTYTLEELQEKGILS